MKRNFSILIDILFLPIKKSPVFFCFIYFLGILTCITECLVLGFNFPKFNLFSLFFDIYIILAISLIISQKIRPFYLSIIAFCLYFLAIVNSFCVETFHAKIGPEILNVVLETNKRESSEFFDKYIGTNLFFSYTFLVIILAFFHITFHFKWKNLKKVIFVTNKKFITTLEVIFTLLIILSTFICLPSRINLIRLTKAKTIKEIDNIVDNFSQNSPFNNLVFAIKMRQIANNGLAVLTETQQQAKIDSCSFLSPNIVLIIGESYIRCHSQLYGYNLETTPKQMQYSQGAISGHLIPFSNVVSPSNLTSTVFKHVFSLKSIEDSLDWSFYPLFPTLFKKAGYSTFFITNQFVKSLNTDIFNISGGLFLNENKLSNIQFSHRNAQSHQYDEALIQDYDSLKQYFTDYNLTIFHLAGQHIDFEKRSPKEWKKFNISNYKKRMDLNKEEKQLVADYDNATLYNDFVLSQIIKQFEDKEVIIIHMPDHGEECYDEQHRMGRIPGNNYQPEILRQEYQIPFWIWVSHSYAQKHPVILKQIIDAKDKPFMTDNLPHMLLFLAGIKCKWYNNKNNPLDTNYNSNRPRLINGVANFNKICK